MRDRLDKISTQGFDENSISWTPYQVQFPFNITKQMSICAGKGKSIFFIT